MACTVIFSCGHNRHGHEGAPSALVVKGEGALVAAKWDLVDFSFSIYSVGQQCIN